MRFTYTALLLAATCGTSVMAAPVPAIADGSIAARGFLDSIIHGVTSIAQPLTSILGGGLGGGKPQQEAAAPDPSEQLWRIDENGNAIPVDMEEQVTEEESAGPLGGLISGLTNVVGGVASKVGGLIGGEDGAATAGSIVNGIGSVAGQIAPIAVPIAEQVAPLALAAAVRR